MNHSFKKLDNLLSLGIKRDNDTFSNGMLSCKLIVDDNLGFYGNIDGMIIEYTDLNSFKYNEEVEFNVFNNANFTQIATEPEEKIKREKLLIITLLEVFLNPQPIIIKHRIKLFQKKVKNKEYYTMNQILKNKGTISYTNFSIYSLTKIQYEVTYYAKGDHDSTIKKTKSYQYFIFYGNSLITDPYLESFLPENEDISESFKSWSINGFNDSEKFELNKYLTKKIKKKYNVKDHQEFIKN